MGKGGGQVPETSQEKAFADVARQRLQDFRTRVQPMMKFQAAAVVRAHEPGSFERERMAGAATADTAAAYAKAGGALTDTAGIGSAREKLGMMGMGDDQATSTGLGLVRAQQANEDQYVGGLETLTALGRGEKATATSGLATSAALTGQQASADASASLDAQLGAAQLAAAVGGYAMGPRPPLEKKKPDPYALPPTGPSGDNIGGYSFHRDE